MRPEEKLQKSKEKLENLSEQSMATARRVGEMELILYNIARENEILKDALQLLHEKLDAVITLQNRGLPLIDSNINEAVVEMKVNSLKERVDEMLKQGAIKTTDTVGEDSLIVSRELSKEGKVENPRLQFLVGRLIDELKSKFVGKKVGDLVQGEENKLDIEIMEVYDLVPKSLGKLDAENELPLEQNNQDS
jgi:FKBP-type peptidyl-prolyl cis-trans isomerase (trigger factor)